MASHFAMCALQLQPTPTLRSTLLYDITCLPFFCITVVLQYYSLSLILIALTLFCAIIYPVIVPPMLMLTKGRLMYRDCRD